MVLGEKNGFFLLGMGPKRREGQKIPCLIGTYGLDTFKYSPFYTAIVLCDLYILCFYCFSSGE